MNLNRKVDMEKLSVIVYTHSNVADAWDMFFGELKKYMPYLDINVFCDLGAHVPHSLEHKFIQYNDAPDTPFFEQYCSCLKQVSTPYVLTLFEDQILYGEVEQSELQRFIDFLDVTTHSFLRLVKTDVHRVIKIEGETDIFINPPEQHYFFSMQPTIWRREDLIEALEHSQIVSIFHEMKVGDSLRELEKTGTYVYKNEKKIGRQHHESSTFPCFEVIERGKWLTSLYGDQLKLLFQEYDINPSIRGLI